MRKKALIEQNFSLFEQLEKLRGENTLKDKRISELEKAVEQLQSERKEEIRKVTVPLKRLEEKVMENSKAEPGIEYASEIIGKLVMESAAGSNELTSGGNTEHRELVNLLLGKTEVAKAEILAVVSEEGDFVDKKEKIDKIADETRDYFASVLAQIK